MARLLSANAVLIGRLTSYTIVKELHRAADEGAVYLARNRSDERCIVKSIRGHWRLRNEADVLTRYQAETPFLRPLVDEIREPADPPSIVLRYLDSDVLVESNKKRLSRPEIKQVARCVLEALRVLHRDGMVHTDVKLDNIFFNYGQGDRRFSEVQLGDCGGVVSQQSSFAREGHVIGAGFTRSPEATFQLPWGTATDIWSFGTAMLSLLFGGGYHLFNPRVEGVDPEDNAYELTALKRMHRFFGPYPRSYGDFNDTATMTIIDFIHRQGPPAKPFARVGPREMPPADKEFILKIMKLDPRDRPTAEELLADTWFMEESPDTRDPLPGEVGQPEEAKQHGEEGPGT
ncbi:kinase-like protein [Trichocladium antarcticum]|uniref:Kinase-like protein n=1 Tax=Trichocladium antarcticum TaxID=1450529 RepID=A0AAN6ZFW5_9PEZI|nr:kinase-like protein [Trichocladium antarcticum]